MWRRPAPRSICAMRGSPRFTRGTGIQANDLIGRKLAPDKGVNAGALIRDMKGELEALAPTNDTDLAAIRSALQAALTLFVGSSISICTRDGRPARRAHQAAPSAGGGCMRGNADHVSACCVWRGRSGGDRGGSRRTPLREDCLERLLLSPIDDFAALPRDRLNQLRDRCFYTVAKVVSLSPRRRVLERGVVSYSLARAGAGKYIDPCRKSW